MGKIPNPIVDGSILDDLIAIGYTDSDGDMVTNDAEDIFAYGGDDYVEAGGGNDRIWGGTGDDTIFGQGGNDKLYGEDGNDELRGGSGRDQLFGGDGDDELFGNGGADKMQGDRGNDTLNGGSGNDSLYGNKGNNELYGGGGDDFLSTGDQTSYANGGSGEDTFSIRMKKGGDHEVTGGADADTFQFIQSGSTAISDVTITDFELGIDQFTIEGVQDTTYLGIIGPAAVTSAGGGADTLLTLTTGDTILFEGVTEAAFEAEYFGFLVG